MCISFGSSHLQEGAQWTGIVTQVGVWVCGCIVTQVGKETSDKRSTLLVWFH